MAALPIIAITAKSNMREIAIFLKCGSQEFSSHTYKNLKPSLWDGLNLSRHQHTALDPLSRNFLD